MSVENVGFESQRAIDAMTGGASYLEALDFVAGCEMIAQAITKERAGVVFFPQRGAGPMEWTIEALAKTAPVPQETPLFVDLPIGTHITINDEHPGQAGITPSEKAAVVQDTFQELVDSGCYIPGETRLMLVDEVQKGGTISRAALEISKAMRAYGDDAKLSVVAVQDNRNDLVGMEKTEGFRIMASNASKYCRTSVVNMALFMVDRTVLLDQIWKLSGGKVSSQDDFEMQPNDDARRMFRTLVEVYRRPKEALEELEGVRREVLAEDIGDTVLQSALVEAMTDPRHVRERVSNLHLVEWWRNFARLAPEF